MKNFLQEGETLDVVAPSGGLTADQVYFVGAIVGVVASTVLEGETTALDRCGVFSLPKTTSQAWAFGDPLYWNPGTSKFTNAWADGVIPAGTAVPNTDGTMAASADTVGAVLLGSPLRTVAGQHTTATAADTVDTGLAKVLTVVATLESDPGDDPMLVSAQVGDQAGAPASGSVILKTWKNTAGTDPTPAAASTFSKKVNWIAVGYGG